MRIYRECATIHIFSIRDSRSFVSFCWCFVLCMRCVIQYVRMSFGLLLFFSFLSLTLWSPLLSHTLTLSRTFETVSLAHQHKHTHFYGVHFCKLLHCVAIVSAIFFSVVVFTCLLVFLFSLFRLSSPRSNFFSFSFRVILPVFAYLHRMRSLLFLLNVIVVVVVVVRFVGAFFNHLYNRQ